MIMAKYLIFSFACLILMETSLNLLTTFVTPDKKRGQSHWEGHSCWEGHTVAEKVTQSLRRSRDNWRKHHLGIILLKK